MKVTVKGQVTIPRHIRDKLGITPNTDVNFQEEGRRGIFNKEKSYSSKEKQISPLSRNCNCQDDYG